MTAKCYRTASTSIMKENRRIATLTAPLDRHATPQARAAPARISFPSHLRLMWRGGEVRAWLNQHQGITPRKRPPTTAWNATSRGRLSKPWPVRPAPAPAVTAPCAIRARHILRPTRNERECHLPTRPAGGHRCRRRRRPGAVSASHQAPRRLSLNAHPNLLTT